MVPLTLVVAPPSHVTCCRQRLVHGSELPHRPGWPLPPHTSGYWQSPHCSSPPHPSPAKPQLKPSPWHVLGVHRGAPSGPRPKPPPHLLKPAAPQICGTGQLPQSMRFPQPSPLAPHSKPCSAQVRGTQRVMMWSGTTSRTGTSMGTSSATTSRPDSASTVTSTVTSEPASAGTPSNNPVRLP